MQISAIGADPASPSQLRQDQGGGRGGGARGLPRRDDPAALHRVRAGGPVLQPLRRYGAAAALHAGGGRRHALPAGLCRRRGRCGGGRAERDGCRGPDLRTGRPAGDELPRRAALHPGHHRPPPADGRHAGRAGAAAGAAVGIPAQPAADPGPAGDAAAGQCGGAGRPGLAELGSRRSRWRRWCRAIWRASGPAAAGGRRSPADRTGSDL